MNTLHTQKTINKNLRNYHRLAHMDSIQKVELSEEEKQQLNELTTFVEMLNGMTVFDAVMKINGSGLTWPTQRLPEFVDVENRYMD